MVKHSKQWKVQVSDGLFACLTDLKIKLVKKKNNFANNFFPRVEGVLLSLWGILGFHRRSCVFDSRLNVIGVLALGVLLSVLRLCTGSYSLICSLKDQKVLETENIFVGFLNSFENKTWREQTWKYFWALGIALDVALHACDGPDINIWLWILPLALLEMTCYNWNNH